MVNPMFHIGRRQLGQASIPPRRAGAVGLAAALGLTPAAAFAHAFLVGAVPAVGATVRTAPGRLALTYTEGVVPHFCRVTLRGPHGSAIPTGRPQAEAGHDRVLLVRLPTLAPGRYTVSWHAVAVDTHRTEGRFAFTVTGTAPVGRSPIGKTP
jgi:methionine-rich copper-binding protein CopC